MAGGFWFTTDTGVHIYVEPGQSVKQAMDAKFGGHTKEDLKGQYNMFEPKGGFTHINESPDGTSITAYYNGQKGNYYDMIDTYGRTGYEVARDAGYSHSEAKNVAKTIAEQAEKEDYTEYESWENITSYYGYDNYNKTGISYEDKESPFEITDSDTHPISVYDKEQYEKDLEDYQNGENSWYDSEEEIKNKYTENPDVKFWDKKTFINGKYNPHFETMTKFTKTNTVKKK